MDMKNIGFPILAEKREKKIPNFILNLIDAYRNMWKTILDESHMYDLKGGLLYLSRSTLQFGIKKPKEIILLALMKGKVILKNHLHVHVMLRY